MRNVSKQIQKLWIVVSENKISPFNNLNEAVAEFPNLAKFVVNNAKIVCLTYNPQGSPNPEGEESPMWKIEEEKLENIAQKMLEKMEGK